MYNQGVNDVKVRIACAFNTESIKEFDRLLGKDVLPMRLKDKLIKLIRDKNKEQRFASDLNYEYTYEEQARDIANSYRLDGEKEGLKRGEAQGRLQGIEETNISVAISMIEEGFDFEMISKISKLPVSKIKELKELISVRGSVPSPNIKSLTKASSN